MKTIREFREGVPMTQLELANEVGVSAWSVANWERGKSKPRPAHVRRMAEVFGVAPKEIILPKPDTST